MVFISIIQGRGARFHTIGFNCNYCEIKSSQMLMDDVSAPIRTLTRMYHLCHMFPPGECVPFTCPGCGGVFSSQEDIDDDHAPADVGLYANSHFGGIWHQPPLLEIEPNKYIFCCRHLLLSLTSLLFKACVLPMLVNDTMAKVLNYILSQVGVCIPKVTKVSANPHTNQSHRIKFTGAECVRLIEQWDNIIDKLVRIAPMPEEAAVRAVSR